MTGAGLGEGFWKELRFSAQISPPVACYDDTMLPGEINRQCTLAQLPVKQRSTGK
jgi:hypothetical protein